MWFNLELVHDVDQFVVSVLQHLVVALGTFLLEELKG